MGSLVSFRGLCLFLVLSVLIGLCDLQPIEDIKDEEQKAASNNVSSHTNLTEHQDVHTVPGKNDAGNSTNTIFNYIPNTAAMLRSFYVFCGLGFLALLYFVIRTCRLRRRRGAARRTGTRKYLPLNAGGSGSQEMEPLGQAAEDDDEDTLFDTSQPTSGNPTA